MMKLWGKSEQNEWVTNASAEPNWADPKDLNERNIMSVGDPKPTNFYSSDELRQMGFIGLYRKVA